MLLKVWEVFLNMCNMYQDAWVEKDRYGMTLNGLDLPVIIRYSFNNK